jgi:hypothetical protein
MKMTVVGEKGQMSKMQEVEQQGVAWRRMRREGGKG